MSAPRPTARPGVTLLLCVLATLALTACDPVDRPNRPLPESFLAHALDGARLDVTALRGKPWVINLWVPR